MKNNTIVTIGDMRYFWGIFLLIASMRKNGMEEPVLVGGFQFPPEAIVALERFGNVRVHGLDHMTRSLTCAKPEIMLLAETDYITWVDSDGFFTGNCSARLIPKRENEIHIRKRSEVENSQAFRNRRFGEDGRLIPQEILDTWRRDVEGEGPPRILQSCSACFLSVHQSARPFLQKWHEQMTRLLPAGNVGVVDRRLQYYHQLDESVLNSLLCFDRSAPEVAPFYRLDKDPNELFVHFIGPLKPWRGWTPYAFRHFKRYTAVMEFAVNAGFIQREEVPFSLEPAHEGICRLLTPYWSFKTKAENRWRRFWNGRRK